MAQLKAKEEAPGLTCTYLVLDHAIYSKALEVLQNPNNADLKEFINLRMGSFHGCGNVLAVICKRFESAGLHHLIVEALLSGSKSVNQILNDKEYNSGIRICKVMFEALQNAKLDMFEECLQKEKKSNILTSFLECEFFTEPIKKRESTVFNTCLESISALHHTNDEFEIKIHNGFPPMTMLWQSYLDMVQILIDFLKSISLPNWNLHLESTERMLAWINYGRHFSYHWCSQQKI